jgi:hypothetical protein
LGKATIALQEELFAGASTELAFGVEVLGHREIGWDESGLIGD